MPLLEVQHLKVQFPAGPRRFGRPRAWIKAVDDVSFQIEAGEILGLVGESGCGKSTLGRAVVGLNRPAAGRILFEGEDLGMLSRAELRRRRRGFQLIFQDPYSSLDPRWVAEDIIGEGLDIHGLAANGADRRRQVMALLEAVGLDADCARRYPREFSGGQRQRLGLARALAVQPKLLVCDEPVSALDVSIQAQIVNLLQDLQQERGLACLFIAHDLAVVRHLSRRIMVMYLGKIVELAEADAVIGHPRHPYTQALISAVPEVDPAEARSRIFLSGEVPSPLNPPPGCPFHPRCPRAEFPRCASKAPLLREVAPGHFTACHFPG